MPWLLNVLYLLLLIVASPWLIYRAIRTGRYREGWQQKFFGFLPATLSEKLNGEKLIWLHGVSVGEVQLLKPLLEQLRLRIPDATFVLSTTTSTGMELAKKILAHESLIYLPFDFTWGVNRVLRTLQPTVLVLGELELWPNLINSAYRRGVPIAVVNGRLSERSFRGYVKFSWFTHSMFNKLGLVAAQDSTYAERFMACGVPVERIRVTGSTKFDNVVFDRQHEQVESLRKLVGLDASHQVWIVGSTQSPEERFSAEAFLALRAEFPALRLIVVPRHQERFEAVYRELQELGVDPLRRSLVRQEISARDWQVLLVDTIGELRWWWGLADLALVGGSFGDRGGQNMLEPAAYGANVAFGPNTSNFRDIADLLLRGESAMRLAQLDEILPWAREQLANPELGRNRGAKAQTIVKLHQGAMLRTVESLLTIIESSESRVPSGRRAPTYNV